MPQWTSEFRYDHSVCTYSLHIVYAKKAAEQYCHWKTKSESVFCEVLLIAWALYNRKSFDFAHDSTEQKDSSSRAGYTVTHVNKNSLAESYEKVLLIGLG